MWTTIRMWLGSTHIRFPRLSQHSQCATQPDVSNKRTSRATANSNEMPKFHTETFILHWHTPTTRRVQRNPFNMSAYNCFVHFLATFFSPNEIVFCVSLLHRPSISPNWTRFRKKNVSIRPDRVHWTSKKKQSEKSVWQLKFSTIVVHFVIHANSNESLFVVAFSFVSHRCKHVTVWMRVCWSERKQEKSR